MFLLREQFHSETRNNRNIHQREEFQRTKPSYTIQRNGVKYCLYRDKTFHVNRKMKELFHGFENEIFFKYKFK